MQCHNTSFCFLFSVMVQYHGLGLLYQIRKTDRLGVTKLVAKLTKMPLKSPYAACHLVTFVISSTIQFVSVTFCDFDDRSEWFVNLLKKKKVLVEK